MKVSNSQTYGPDQVRDLSESWKQTDSNAKNVPGYCGEPLLAQAQVASSHGVTSIRSMLSDFASKKLNLATQSSYVSWLGHSYRSRDQLAYSSYRGLMEARSLSGKAHLLPSAIGVKGSIPSSITCGQDSLSQFIKRRSLAVKHSRKEKLWTNN